eukprot:CAMPEP_0177753232 /NCGR_PEP_ID=MMETSP0491_2-20121128/1344_1 /TAXON_ID=63592 /ORGANISM="Tetraselmis chuii, Strain PLY429" /LENGTH=152 /DNA_ID=CAMNT_0019268491 /DNA_START=14 /DNA_END=472 /DNA_ORIENTATION=+
MAAMEESKLVFMLLFFSVVELFAAIEFCDSNSCSNEAAWAVAAGAVSTAALIVLTFFMLRSPENYNKVVPNASGLLALWWMPGAGVTTFKAPFATVGNGYYAAWGALISAIFHPRMGSSYLRGIMSPQVASQPTPGAPSHQQTTSVVVAPSQ